MATPVEQIAEQEQALRQAMLDGNVKVLDSIIADDLIFTDHNGQVMGKMADIESHRSGKLKVDQLEPSEQVINIYGSTAIVSVLMAIKGRYMDQPFQGKIRYTRTWVNIDNAWTIVAGHSSLASSEA
jgi:Protein of unknown function (DUF3225).